MPANIFSIKNSGINKIITFMGIKISLKRRSAENAELINKIYSIANEKTDEQRHIAAELKSVLSDEHRHISDISAELRNALSDNLNALDSKSNILLSELKKLTDNPGRLIINPKCLAYLGIKDNTPDSFKTYMLAHNMPEKISLLKKDLDKKSADLIDETLNKIINLPDWKYAKFFYCKEEEFKRHFQTEKDKEYETLSQNLYWDVRKQYKLSKDEYEMGVFIYHHGLKTAPAKIKEYIKNKVFIDAGAFTGDSALVFLKNYSPEKVYSFEILNENIEFYKKTMELNNISTDKYELIQKGLSNKDGSVIVSDCDGMSGNVYSQTGYEVKTLALDDYLKGSDINIGFIKADIEGAMLDALSGMREAIQRCRPVLSFSIYHSPQEFFEVKPLLSEIVQNLNYTIKICNNESECFHIYGTEIFAYPKELEN